MAVIPEQKAFADSLLETFQSPEERGVSPFSGTGTPLAEDVFVPDIPGASVQKAHPGNFEKFFQGVQSGVIDAVTLGLVDSKAPEGFAGGAGNLLGMVAGEVPFFLIGGSIAKHAVSNSIRVARLARKAPRIFGAAVEAGTATAVDVGRSVAGEEDVFTPTRIAANVVLPFAIAKLRKAPRPRIKDTFPAQLKEGPQPFQQIEGTRPQHLQLTEGTKPHQLKQGGPLPPELQLTEGRPTALPGQLSRTKEQVNADIQSVWGMGNEDDAAGYVAYQSLWGYKSGSSTHINQLVDLFKQGAPYDHLRMLTHPDDIADYLKVVDKSGWEKKAASRVDANTAFVRNSLAAQFRDAPGGAQVAGSIPFEDAGTVVKRLNQPGAVAAEERMIDDVAKVIPHARVYAPVEGGGGVRSPYHYDEASFGKVNDPPMLDVPVDAMGDHVRTYIDAVAAAPIVNRVVVNSLRALEAMPGGRQVAGFMREARRWVHARTGGAHADMLNAFKEMKTADQYSKFVQGVDKGIPTSDKTVQAAINVFRLHQKNLERTFVDQGVEVVMAGGTTEPLVSVAEKFFFPHKHDWNALLKDKDALELAAKRISDILGDAVPGQSPKKVLETYLQNMDNARIPRFSALHERNVNLPGWLGDPDTMIARGEKGYKADVQESVMDFLEDAYGMAGYNMYLGAPRGLDIQDDMNMWTDLAPVHNAIKDILDKAKGVAPGSFRDTPTTRATAAFGDVKTLATQAAKDMALEVDDSVARDVVKKVERKMGAAGGREVPWKLQPMLAEMSRQGGDADLAVQIVQHVMGAKYYHRNRQKVSKWVRDANIVTKLGVMVAENMGQISFSVTKTGFRNVAKALRDVIDPRTKDATIEEVTRWGVLLEDAMKGLEGDAGRSFAGKFLEKVGFRWSERYLRTTAAVAGKYHVQDLFKTLGKVPGPNAGTLEKIAWRKAVRQLDKYGFHMSKVVDRKTQSLTDLGHEMVNSMADGSDDALAGAIKQLAGFEGARGTQFIADVMDNPIAWQSPEAKILTQFKTFVTNSTKFAVREIIDEAAHGNPGPALRMLFTGVVVGEITQNAKDLVSGVDPRERGQGGFIREKIGEMFGIRDLPDDDEAMFAVLGQKISTNDLAARTLENVLTVGYAGIFWSAAQAAVQGGKMRLYGLLGGPTIETGLDVAAGLSEAVGGDPTRLGRRALREGASVAGGLVPMSGVAFAGAAAGRHAQLAALPTERQLERSLYVTPEEQKEVAQRQVVRRYNNVRTAAKEAVVSGDRQEAMRLVSAWHGQLKTELDQLINLGALNSSIIKKLTFDGNDIKRLLLSTEEVEPSPVDRVQGAFQNVQGIASQPMIQQLQ